MSEKYGSKAIKTEYKGITFKSMIEAKYAQKFDELGLKWEYEPKNYMLSNGLNYMPDFHFVGTDTYFEVKGVKDWKEIPAIDGWKIDGFMIDYPQKTIILGDSTGYFNAPLGKYHEYHLTKEDPEEWERIWKWKDVLKFGDDSPGLCKEWNGIYLIKCGTCDEKYFVNPWSRFNKNKTYCPKCGALCFAIDDDGEEEDIELRRSSLYEIWRPRNLFEGEFRMSCYYDVEETESI